jgi:hypothetical protein
VYYYQGIKKETLGAKEVTGGGGVTGIISNMSALLIRRICRLACFWAVVFV